MKLTDWIIAISLVIIGLSCLTMSATSMMNTLSFVAYFNNFVRICLFIGIPLTIVGIVFLILKARKKGGPK